MYRKKLKELTALDIILREAADSVLKTSPSEILEEITEEYGDPELFYKEFEEAAANARRRLDLGTKSKIDNFNL